MAVVFVVGAIVAGLAMTLFGGSDPSAPPAAAAPVEPGPAIPAAGTPTDLDQSIPRVSPPLRWGTFEGAMVPAGESIYGPTRSRGPGGAIADGWAQTPRSGLVAAYNIVVRLTMSTDGWRDVMHQQVIPGAGRDIVEAYRPGSNDPIPASRAPWPSGFNVLNYGSGGETIAFLQQQQSDGTWWARDITVRWTDGPGGPGWRLELRPDGRLSAHVEQVTDTTAYAAWGPVE